MLRRSCVSLWARATTVALQGWGGGGGGSGGWGTSDSGSGGGGWGSSDAASTGGGGWGGSGGSGGGGSGGWGSSDSGAAAPASGGGWGGSSGGGGGSGGWGSESGSGGWGNEGGSGGRSSGGRSGGRRGRGSRDSGSGGGWGARESSGGGGGDWGGGGGGRPSWGGDGGWRDSPAGGRGRGARGNFRRGRQGGQDGGGRGGGMWGQPAAADEEAWNAAPPSFQPPVRRVDPLSLTAVEVEVDGVRKLVGQRVLVSGLSDETTWHTLKDHLRQAGDLGFCRTFSGGRGVAEFATPEEAARCITELQASELEGATLYLREDREDTVLINTRRKIREARDAQLRARKDAAERERAAKAVEQGDTPEPTAAPPA